jgi:hypothetical protein
MLWGGELEVGVCGAFVDIKGDGKEQVFVFVNGGAPAHTDGFDRPSREVGEAFQDTVYLRAMKLEFEPPSCRTQEDREGMATSV